MSAPANLTSLVESARAASDQRTRLLQRLAQRMEAIVADASPEAVSSVELIIRTAAEEGAMPRDAATTLWNLVDDGKLQYLADSTVTAGRVR